MTTGGILFDPSLGEILFDPTLKLPGESDAQAKLRVENNKQTFREVLNTTQGKAMLQLLAGASPPYGPRFTGDYNTAQAAFKDGEKSVIALMILNGTDSIL